MRRLSTMYAGILGLFVSSCATIPAEELRENKQALEAARECQRQHPGVTVTRTTFDHNFRVSFKDSRRESVAAFQLCVFERLEALQLDTSGRFVFGAGAPTRTAVSVRVLSGSVLVPVRVNGKEVTLLLDTGASGITLSPEVAARAGVVIPSGARRRTAVVAGGRTITIPMTRVPTVAVGDMTVEDIDVGVYEILPESKFIDGVLGMTFLRFFRFTLDGQARQLLLEALSQAAPAAR